MASLAEALKLYAKMSFVGLVTSYGYLYYRCNKLKKEAMDFDMVNAKKDATRPSNVYYGINWGYRSDEMIEKSLDTGDLLFFSYDCLNQFSPMEVALCYKQKTLGRLAEGDP